MSYHITFPFSECLRHCETTCKSSGDAVQCRRDRRASSRTLARRLPMLQKRNTILHVHLFDNLNKSISCQADAKPRAQVVGHDKHTFARNSGVMRLSLAACFAISTSVTWRRDFTGAQQPTSQAMPLQSSSGNAGKNQKPSRLVLDFLTRDDGQDPPSANARRLLSGDHVGLDMGGIAHVNALVQAMTLGVSACALAKRGGITHYTLHIMHCVLHVNTDWRTAADE